MKHEIYYEERVCMVVKVAIAMTGVSKTTKFFKPAEQALAWLKGEQ